MKQVDNTKPDSYQQSAEPPTDWRTARKKIGFFRLLSAGLAVLLIFSLGVGVGSGRINVGHSAVFRDTQNRDLPENLDFTSVEQMYDVLRRQFDGQLSEQDLLDGVKRGMAEATGDAYTEYLNADEAKEFDDDLNGTFSGIGAELTREGETIVIVSPIAGFPAQEAGLRSGDVIISIDDQTALGLSVSEAVSKIRGEVGTKVKLKVVRDGEKELDFEITREQISIPSTEHEILDGNIGYLKISRFAEDTTTLATKAANEFKQKNVKAVVLDLRGNPGGLLDASVSLSGIWLQKGKTVLLEKRSDVTIRTFTSNGPATLTNVPTVVLIDEGSASASEIVAGALQDNKVATLIGVTTFGKGSVQSLQQLISGGVLKVTTARWFTPNGKNIDKEGIDPDKSIERTAEDAEADRDPQLDAAKDFLKN